MGLLNYLNYNDGVARGLQRARNHLIETAEGYERMADQILKRCSVDCKYSLARTADVATAQNYKDKATLLRVHAAFIMEMMP